MAISKFGTHREIEDTLHLTQDVKLLRSRTDLMSRELVQNSDWIKELNRTISTLDKVVGEINTNLNTTVDQQNAHLIPSG